MLKLLVFYLCSICLLPSSYAMEVEVSNSKRRIDLSPNIEYWQDPSGSAAFEQTLSDKSINFTPNHSNSLTFGRDSSTFWLRFLLKPREEDQITRILEFASAQLDSVDLFLADSKGIYKKYSSGDEISHSLWSIDWKNPAFLIPYTLGNQYPIYVRVKSSSPLTLSPTLWYIQDFSSHTRTQLVIFGLLLGMAISLVIYNLMIYYTIHDSAYIDYVGFISSGLLGVLAETGLGNLYLWDGYIAFHQIADRLGFAASLYFLCRMSQHALQVRDQNPKLAYTLRLVEYFCLTFVSIYIVGLFLEPVHLFTPIDHLFTLWTIGLPLSLLFACFLLLRRQNNTLAKLVMISCFGVFVIHLVNEGSRTGIAPNEFVIIYGSSVGLVVQGILFSLVLAYRLKFLELQKLAAKEKASQKKYFDETIGQIQQFTNFVPPNLEQHTGYQVAKYCVPADTAGGDWLCIEQTPHNNRLYILAGDVNGQGIIPNLVTVSSAGAARGTLASLNDHSSSLTISRELELIANAINRSLLNQNQIRQLAMTMALIGIDLDSGKGTYINAGHPGVLVVSDHTKTLLARGSPLGLTHTLNLNMIEFELEPGNQLFIASDGLFENHGPGGDVVSQRAIRKILDQHDRPAKTKENILRYCRSIWLNQPFSDDCTFLIFQWDGSKASQEASAS